MIGGFPVADGSSYADLLIDRRRCDAVPRMGHVRGSGFRRPRRADPRPRSPPPPCRFRKRWHSAGSAGRRASLRVTGRARVPGVQPGRRTGMDRRRRRCRAHPRSAPVVVDIVSGHWPMLTAARGARPPSTVRRSTEGSAVTIDRDTVAFTVRELDGSSWDAFAELVERNGGIFGGCWCIGFHPECRAAGHRPPRGQGGAGPHRPRPRRARFRRVSAVPRVGASRAVPTSSPGSSTAGCTSRTPRRCPTGGSRASTSTRAIAGRESPAPRWVAPWSRSPGRWRSGRGDPRGHRRVETRTADFCSARPSSCSRTTASTRVRQVGKHAWIVSKVVPPTTASPAST